MAGKKRGSGSKASVARSESAAPAEPLVLTPAAVQAELAQFGVMPVAQLQSSKWDGNPREISTHDFEALKRSLATFGVVEPVVFNRRTNRVVGGHQRIDAMAALGIQECPVRYVDLDEQTEVALNVALNRIHGDWKWDGVAAILQQLDDETRILTGFTDHELTEFEREGHLLLLRAEEARSDLKAFVAASAPTLVDPDEPPPPPPETPVSRRGDIWILGEHRILCGDSTNADDVARVLGGDRAALLSTDPPYCVDYTGDRPNDSGKDWTHVYHEIDIKDIGKFLDAVFTAVLPHVEDRAPIYVWCSSRQFVAIGLSFARHGINLSQEIVWVKPMPSFTHAWYPWKHEPCLLGFRKGQWKPPEKYHGVPTVWEIDWEGKSRVVGNEHPTQKPLRLFEIPMEQHTKPGDVVLEPFSGSGSQLIAAEKLGRRCRAIEIEPTFVDVGCRRFWKATGKEPTLQSTGATFTQTASERGVPIDPCS